MRFFIHMVLFTLAFTLGVCLNAEAKDVTVYAEKVTSQFDNKDITLEPTGTGRVQINSNDMELGLEDSSNVTFYFNSTGGSPLPGMRYNFTNGTLEFSNNGSDWYVFATGGAAGVVGSGLSTDNAIARWDGVTGTAIQDSGIQIDDLDNVTGVNDLSVGGTATLSSVADGFATITAGAVGSQASIDLATDVTGNLGVNSGGTGAGAFTQGAIPYMGPSAFAEDPTNLSWDNSAKIFYLNDYELADGRLLTLANGNEMFVQAKSAGSATILSVSSEDADGTDDNALRVYAKGNKADATNSEYVDMRWDATHSSFLIGTEQTGTGLAQDLEMWAGGNDNQLKLKTDGSVQIANGQVDVSSAGLSFPGGSAIKINDILDEDDMLSNSATALATQQSIKAYVDANSANPAAGLTDGSVPFVSSGSFVEDNTNLLWDDATDTLTVNDLHFNGSVISDDSGFGWWQSETGGTGPDGVWAVASDNASATNDTAMRVYGRGKAGATTNSEYLSMNWETAGGRYVIETVATGTGTNRDLEINSSGNADQVVLETNGAVRIGNGQVNIDGSGLTLANGATVNWIRDEDNMLSDSATSLATQQSIKAYVDAVFGGAGPGGSLDLQHVYDQSTDGDVIVDATRGSFQVQDAATPIGAPLLEVLSNDGLTTYFHAEAQAIQLPAGTTADRPACAAGAYKIRFNTDTSSFEGCDGSVWGEIAGGSELTIAAKGDLQGHDGTSLVTIPVGTDGQVLTADSGAAAGVSYQDVAATLQDAYDNSAAGNITLDGTIQGVTIADNATPIGVKLFQVTDSTLASEYFGVYSDGAVVNGEFFVNSTTNPSRPIPDMSLAQRQAISAPNSGDMVYDTVLSKPAYYSGDLSRWVMPDEMTNSRLNMIDNPSFETGKTSGFCTGCTPTIGFSFKKSPSNTRAMTVTDDGAGSDWLLYYAHGAGYETTPGLLRFWVDTTDDIVFQSYIDGTAGTEEGTTQITVAGNTEPQLVELPTVLGASNAGVKALLDANESFSIDEIYVGAQPAGYIQSINDVDTDWITYTPTFSGITASSSNFEYKRDGDSLWIKGKVTLDAGATGQIEIGLPNSLIVEETTTDRSMVVQGYDNSASQFHSGFAQAPSGQDVVRVIDDASVGTWDATVPFTWASGDVIHIPPTLIKIQGWETGRTNVIEQKKELTAETANSFDFNVAATLTVSSDELDFVNGNCTNPSGTLVRCSWNSGIFTSAPSCGADMSLGSYNGRVSVASVTTTYVEIQAYDATGAGAFRDVRIECSKADDDFNKSINVDGYFNASQIKGLKKKCQTKYLSADVTSDGTISELGFSGLVVGSYYRLTLSMRSIRPDPGVDNVELVATGAVGNTFVITHGLAGGGSAINSSKVSPPFPATSSSITVSSSSVATGSSITGNGTHTETHTTLCEIPSDTIEETTEW